MNLKIKALISVARCRMAQAVRAGYARYNDTVHGVRWRWVYYKAASGRVPVREYIEAQTEEVQERMFRDMERLVEVNVRLGPPYVRKLAGRDFWELRTVVSGDIYRTFYFAYTGRKFVLLHAYQKKSQKVPKRELDVAEERMKDYQERAGRSEK
jgi:phage-related protein